MPGMKHVFAAKEGQERVYAEKEKKGEPTCIVGWDYLEEN